MFLATKLVLNGELPQGCLLAIRVKKVLRIIEGCIENSLPPEERLVAKRKVAPATNVFEEEEEEEEDHKPLKKRRVGRPPKQPRIISNIEVEEETVEPPKKRRGPGRPPKNATTKRDSKHSGKVVKSIPPRKKAPRVKSYVEHVSDSEESSVAAGRPAKATDRASKLNLLRSGLVEALDSHKTTVRSMQAQVNDLQSQLNSFKEQGKNMKKLLGTLNELEKDDEKVREVVQTLDKLPVNQLTQAYGTLRKIYLGKRSA